MRHQTGFVQPTKPSENIQKMVFVLFFIWHFHAEKLNGNQHWPGQHRYYNAQPAKCSKNDADDGKERTS